MNIFSSGHWCVCKVHFSARPRAPSLNGAQVSNPRRPGADSNVGKSRNDGKLMDKLKENYGTAFIFPSNFSSLIAPLPPGVNFPPPPLSAPAAPWFSGILMIPFSPRENTYDQHVFILTHSHTFVIILVLRISRCIK